MKNGFAGLGLIVLIVIAAGVAGYFVFVQKFDTQIATSPTPSDGIFCTQDAKLCPDGSYVSRTAPKCEFAPCPTLSVTDWKTYTNMSLGVTLKYPPDWHARSLDNTGIISSYIELSQPVPDVRAKIEINNFDNPKKLSSKEWYTDWTSDRQDPDTSTEAQSITIDGAQAYVRIDRSLSVEGTVRYLVYLQKNDKIYSFWAGGNTKFEQTLFQILSTFEFTK